MATTTSPTPRKRGRPRKAESTATNHPTPADLLSGFDQLPDCAYVRLPVVRALFGGCSASTIWRAVKNGGVPQPVTIAERMTGWRVGDLRQALSERRAA